MDVYDCVCSFRCAVLWLCSGAAWWRRDLMRLLYVWVTAIVSCALVTIFWLIGNDIVLAIVNSAIGEPTGQAYSLITILEYFATWWGPVFDVVIIFWAVMSSEQEEISSVLYRA
jgi:hypothetical protein